MTWTEIHTTKAKEDGDGWRSLCNSRPKRLESLKEGRKEGREEEEEEEEEEEKDDDDEDG